MVNKTTFAISAVVIAVATTASAQSLRNAKPPANLPPASFDGLQFVDNNNCVYVRSGYGGRVTWVPRVDRKRRQLCDKSFRPTFEPVRTATATPSAEVEAPAATKPAKTGGFLAGLQKSLQTTTKPAPKAVIASEPVIEETVEPVIEAPATVVAAVEPDVAAKPKLNLKDLFAKRKKAAGEAAPEVAAPVVVEPAIMEPDIALKPKPSLKDIFGKRKTAAVDAKPKIVEPEPVAVAPVIAAPKVVEPVVAAKPKLTLKEIFAKRKTAAVEAKPEMVEPVAVAPVIVAPKVAEPVVAAKPKPTLKEIFAKRKTAALEKAPKPAEPKPVAPVVVKPEVVAPVAGLPSGVYVKVGRFSNRNKANEVVSWFRKSGHKGARMDGDDLMVGPYRSESVAKAALYQATGAGYKNARIVER